MYFTYVCERKLLKLSLLKVIAEIVQKGVAIVQHKERLISKSRKSSQSIFTDSDERWIVQQVKANPRLIAPKLAAEIEKHVQKMLTLRRLELS